MKASLSLRPRSTGPLRLRGSPVRLQLQPHNTGHSVCVSVKGGFAGPYAALSEFAGFDPAASEFAGFGPYLSSQASTPILVRRASLFAFSQFVFESLLYGALYRSIKALSFKSSQASIHDPPLAMQRSGSVSSNSSRNDMKEPLLIPPTALETYGYPDASVSTAGSQRGAPRVSIAQTYAIFMPRASVSDQDHGHVQRVARQQLRR
jgi:hypothetical protein